jgi:hypothetical protein
MGETVPATEADLLCRYLAEHDAPCPVCRYNLRGCTSPTCPECGEPLALSLGGTGTNALWYLASVLFAAYVLTSFTLSLLTSATQFAVLGGVIGQPVWVVGLALGVVKVLIGAALLGGVLVARRRRWRLRRIRWLILMIGVVSFGILLIGWGLQIVGLILAF